MTHAGPRHIANAAAPTKHAVPGRRVPWLRIIGGVAMLVALASVLGTGAFAAGLRVVGPWSAAAALALGLFSTVCTALRWRLIAQRVGLAAGCRRGRRRELPCRVPQLRPARRRAR